MQQQIAPNPNINNVNGIDLPKYDTTEPEIFDPFQDANEFFWSQPYYDSQTNSFGSINPETEQFDPLPKQYEIAPKIIEVHKRANPEFAEFIEKESDEPKPVPQTLRKTLESLLSNIPEPEPPEDRSEVIPITQAYPFGENWYFQDAAFAKSFLCTITATPRPWMLEGYLILPAKLISRIRSGPSNHQQSTQCLYVKEWPFADYNPFEMTKEQLMAQK